MNDTPDYKIVVKVKNNWLLSKMRAAGFETAADLHRACGVRQTEIGKFVNFKKAAFNKKTADYMSALNRIAETLRCLPEDLVPPQHRNQVMELNSFELTKSADDIIAIIYHEQKSPEQELMIKEALVLLTDELEKLPPRQERILRERFGLNGGTVKTLEDVGAELGVNRERVRQLEANALKKIRKSISTKRTKLDAYLGDLAS